MYGIIVLYILCFILSFFCIEYDLKRAFLTYEEKIHIRVIIGIIVLLWGLIPLLGCFTKESTYHYLFQKYGNIILGYFIFFSGLSALIHLVLIIIEKAKAIKVAGRKECRRILSLLIISTLVLNIYGTYHAYDLRTSYYTVNTHKDINLRIILITDLHLSVNTNYDHIKDMVEKINKEEGDIILVGGDIFTSNYGGLRYPDKYSKLLSHMKSKYGSYGVYGNHDVEEPLLGGFAMNTGIPKRSTYMEKFMNDSHIYMLNDEVVDIEKVQLVGRQSAEKTGTDKDRADFSTFKLDTNKPIIVLEHEPTELASLSQSGVDLVLSGHTHNGQIFPGNFITRLFNPVVYGQKTFGEMDVIVSSGVGFYGPPLRIGTNSEITVIDVK